MVVYHLIGIIVKNRKENAVKLQRILTKYGNLIRTRLGINETKLEREHGLVIIHAEGDKDKLENMLKEINSINGLKAKMMEIES